MDDRPRLRLPFGAGVDRNAGQYAVVPGQARALIDFLAEEGRIEARKGLTPVVAVTLSTTALPATDLVHIAPFRAAGVGMLVAGEYPGPTSGPNALEFWRTSTTGFNPVFVGLFPSPTTPPKIAVPQVFGAEVNARLFYAHDERDIAYRRTTRVITTAYAVSDLTADLDGAGAAVVKFRGVARWGDYLLGWGFGSASDPDRKEVVRISLPGDPLTFRATRYWTVGARSEAVLNCLPGRTFAWALKETETYILTGTDASNFGIQLIDPTFGLVGAHLAVVVEEELFGWSRQGPRVWSAEGSVDLGLPLDLGGPSPEDLAAGGDAALGWAAYDPAQRLVLFAFPDRDLDRTRVYALSRRDPSHPRWSYMELQRAVMSAGSLYALPSGPPAGYPDQGPLAAADLDLTVSWTNTFASGDETVEVWLKVGAGAYTLVRSVPVAGTSQSLVLHEADGVRFAALHTVALRYRRATDYTVGYAGDVTGGWTAGAVSQSVESITTAAEPGAPTGVALTVCKEDVYGAKHYLSYKVQWTNGVASGVTEVLVSATHDPATATSVTATTVSGLGLSQESDWFGGWWTAGGSGPFYVWVRHTVGGVSGAAVEAAGSPIVPADGCAL